MSFPCGRSLLDWIRLYRIDCIYICAYHCENWINFQRCCRKIYLPVPNYVITFFCFYFDNTVWQFTRIPSFEKTIYLKKKKKTILRTLHPHIVSISIWLIEHIGNITLYELRICNVRCNLTRKPLLSINLKKYIFSRIPWEHFLYIVF